MVFWIITPLQSAIFTTGVVTRALNTTMVTSSALVNMREQKAALTANFIGSAFGIAWLDEKLPPFTTNDVAFVPFRPAQAILRHDTHRIVDNYCQRLLYQLDL